MRTDAEKLKDFRTEQRLTQNALANKLGFKLSRISMIECGKNNISTDFKLKLKEIFNYDIDKEEYVKEKYYSKVFPIPFYHVRAAASPDTGIVIADFPESECLYFDFRWLKNVLGVEPAYCSLIETKGDSMDSGLNKQDDIKDGDLLLVDNSDVNIVNGKTYIVEISATNELLVKKVKVDLNGKISLISNNPKYPVRELTEADNAIIQGRVVWNGSRGNI